MPFDMLSLVLIKITNILKYFKFSVYTKYAVKFVWWDARAHTVNKFCPQLKCQIIQEISLIYSSFLLDTSSEMLANVYEQFEDDAKSFKFTSNFEVFKLTRIQSVGLVHLHHQFEGTYTMKTHSKSANYRSVQ